MFTRFQSEHNKMYTVANQQINKSWKCIGNKIDTYIVTAETIGKSWKSSQDPRYAKPDRLVVIQMCSHHCAIFIYAHDDHDN